VRLLLDEHYSPKIAEQLRDRGHDVESVSERDDLRGLGDLELWNRASAERRALVTENVADLVRLVREAAAAGEPHFGVVFTSPATFARSAATVGLFVEALAALLGARPAEDALGGQVHWLH
jgi:predicted nuclease of predicted toxin-antitoxin system